MNDQNRQTNQPRRAFLRLGAAAGLAVPATLYAQHNHNAAPASATAQNAGAGAAGGNRPRGMQMANHGHSSSRAATPAYTGSSQLADASVLPTGRPLPPLQKLANTSKERGKFVATLRAQPEQRDWVPGHPTTVWCYNHSIPGPLVDVTEGDTVEIQFENHLAQESTVHWHGVATPPDQDGNPPDIVLPGASRQYRYTLPPDSASTNWYHPHPHEMTSEQVSYGLAGPFIVRPANDPLAHLPEQHLFISDLRLADDGNIPPNTRRDWMFGREGQFTLINGEHRPHIHVDGTQRWRIWNACNARYLRLMLGGQPFTLVGTDGGLLQQPVHGLTELLLTPAQRAEIIIHPPEGGGSTELRNVAYDRGAGGRNRQSDQPLASITFARQPELRPVPDTLRTMIALGEPQAFHTVFMTELMDMDVMRNSSGNTPYARPQGLYLMLNGQIYDMNRTDITARQGQVEQWQVTNLSGMGMDHPFHVHGEPFQVVEREFQGQRTPEPLLAWRDTINVRAGETVRFRMVQKHIGLRMFHCHILEHEDLGMMGNLMVLAPS